MTTPDRLAAAVAQGHEDAVQVVREAESALIQATDGDSPATWAGTPWWHVHRLLRVLTTPAPVSSPAGEEQERASTAEVAEAMTQAAFAQIAAEEMLTVLPTKYGAQVPSHWRKKAEERARPYIAVLAALSARPAEAQEVERLPDMGQEWPSEEARLRYVVGELQRAGAAALARAEALRKVLADFAEHGTRFDLNPTTDGTPLAFVRYIGRIDESVRAKAARALLDGDSEGRESGQPVAQEVEWSEQDLALDVQRLSMEVERLRAEARAVYGVRDRYMAERDAALARAAAAEAVIEKAQRGIRTLLPGLRLANYVERWASGSPAIQALNDLLSVVGEPSAEAGERVDPDVPTAHETRPAGRALLDGDSEGRESGQPVAQESEEEWRVEWEYAAGCFELMYQGPSEADAREVCEGRFRTLARRTVTPWVPVGDEARP